MWTDILILAAREDAVLGRLAACAVAAGRSCYTLGSLLIVAGTPEALDVFVVDAASSLAAHEAAATRVLRTELDLEHAGALDVLALALGAETLAAVAARAVHGELLDALESGVGVYAAYQPVIEIGSRRTVAFEALLRLEHGGRVVPPLDVFRAAADAGRLTAAEHAARVAAIQGAAGWIGDRSLVLNLLPHAIVSPEDIDGTDAAVEAAGLDRSQVVFEVAVPGDDDERHVVRVLEHLRMRGYGIALDDVTDDAASLDLVRQVQPDSLKVAPALVRELPGLQARAAVAAVLGAAHAAGSRVGVKGIETAAHLEAVLLAGVDDAQGWQVGQPMRAPGRRSVVTS